jgi:eukaryotic-like serine/threonine-protein kinase
MKSRSLLDPPPGAETSTLPTPGFRRRTAGCALQFQPGDRVAARFRVVRFLGQGGMAQVYEAEDLELGQSVAIKVLRSDIANDFRAARLLKTEVLLARRVTHPNVCRIFDVFQHAAAGGNEASAKLVVVMELLRGETLAGRLRCSPLPPVQALPLIEQMAMGLAAAHAAGVAHLDLKSGNVLLVPEREGVRAVITDFGLAQRTDLPDSPVAGSARILRGTAAYMAPEQVAGQRVTAAADLYSFAVVVYEMLTGRLPFHGETPRATAERRLTEPPTPPRVYAPHLEPVWEQAILRGLERDPSRRFGSAIELAAVLGGRDSGKKVGGSFHWARAAAVCSLLGLLAASFVFLPVWHSHATAAFGTPRESLARNTASLEAQRLYEDGLAAFRASDALGAVRLLERAIAIDPAFCLAHSTLADAWMELGYMTRAQQQAKRAFELSVDLPREERLWVEARYHQINSKWEEAIQKYQALWTFFPDNPEYALRLAAAQTLAGRSAESLATLEALGRSRFHLADPRADLVEATAAGLRSAYGRQLVAARRGASQAAALGRWRTLGQARLLQGEALRELGQLKVAQAEQRAARMAFVTAGDRAGAAQALFELAVSYRYAYQLDEAERTLAESLSIFREMGNRAGEAEAFREYGHIAARSGRTEEAHKRFAAALAIFREIGHPLGEERTQTNLAELLGFEGRLAESARQLEESLVLVRAFGDKRGEALVMMSLAERVRHWDLAASLQLLEKAASICQRIGNTPCSANVLMRIGCVEREAGHLARAEKALMQSRAIFRDIGNQGGEAFAGIRLARLYLERGRSVEAVGLIKASIRHFTTHGARGDGAASWALLADALLAHGRRDEAAAALQHAQALFPRIGHRVEAMRSMIAQARVLHGLGRSVEAEELLAKTEAGAVAMGSHALRIEAALGRETIAASLEKGRGHCSALMTLEAEARVRQLGLFAAKAAAARRDCQGMV